MPTTLTPTNYWRFENPPTAVTGYWRYLDIIANKGFDVQTLSVSGTKTTGLYSQLSGGPVAKYLSFTGQTTNPGLLQYLTYVKVDSLVLTNDFAIEFIFKPGRRFWNTTFFYSKGASQPLEIRFFAGDSAGNSIPYITFYWNGQSTQFFFDGINRKSANYLFDGNWHHVVFKTQANTGLQEIWIDGQCPDGFSLTGTSFTFNTVTHPITYLLSDGFSYYRSFDGFIDEVAYYNQPLPGVLILEHYNNFISGSPYSYTTNITSVPTPQTTSGTYNVYEYPPGSTLISATQASLSGETFSATTGVTITPITQLQTYRLPRYKSGHTLFNLFNWMDTKYLGGYGQRSASNTTPILYTGGGYTDTQVRNNSLLINFELADKWNYCLS